MFCTDISKGGIFGLKVLRKQDLYIIYFIVFYSFGQIRYVYQLLLLPQGWFIYQASWTELNTDF